jgi:hypothetical protein
MSRRASIVTAVVALLVIALGLWFWFTRPAPATPAPAPVSANQPQGSLGGQVPVRVDVAVTPAPAAAPAKPDSSAAVKRLAAAFAERFGSFSTLGDYQNRLDLVPLMTDAYAAKTRAEVAALQAKPAPEAFYGVTTRSLSVTVRDLDEAQGLAVLIVKTQRQESTGTAGQYAVRYQDIRVGMLKEGNAWKVNSAAWQ